MTVKHITDEERQLLADATAKLVIDKARVVQFREQLFVAERQAAEQQRVVSEIRRKIIKSAGFDPDYSKICKDMVHVVEGA